MDTGFSSHRPHVRGLTDVAHPRPGSVSVSTVTEWTFVSAAFYQLCFKSNLRFADNNWIQLLSAKRKLLLWQSW
jgi:hypothetical protein